MYENKKKTLGLKYQHLWIRKDGSKTTNPWEIVDDLKRHNCAKCYNEKAVKEFVIYGSKYKLKSYVIQYQEVKMINMSNS